MRIGRRYLGKVVELTWRDPTFRRCDMREVVEGRKSLSTWREYGVVHSLTDGVIQIVHSAANNVATATDPPAADEIAYTSIHLALVEKIVVFEPLTGRGR